jgi:[acyl-carrier-protein] S-malonyltransferase
MNDTTRTQASLAVVFPGQGSQSVGMLKSLAEQSPAVTETFQEASSVLDYDLWHLVSEGPKDALDCTDRTQPAMLAAGVAVWRVWTESGGPIPALMAGHSLGEYTALVCAGALAFPDAVRLVAERGRLMQEAVPPGVGAMAAILGLDDDGVRQACDKAAQGQIVAAVNFNSPGQVVIAGHKEAVARAMDVARAGGAKRALLLPVSVPSHCSLMLPAAQRFAAFLAEADFRAPRIPVIQNVDAVSHDTVESLVAALERQLHSPVRWVETVRGLGAKGIKLVLEAGPGKVLASLNKRIDKAQEALSVYDPDTLSEALETAARYA